LQVFAGVALAIVTAAAVGADDADAARKTQIRQFLSRMSESPPTVDVRTAESSVNVTVHGTFRIDSDTGGPSERAVKFLEGNGVARELGLPGRCHVYDVADNDARGPVVVRIDFYDGDARIDGASAIVHVRGDEIRYLNAGYPVHRARTSNSAEPVLTVEQVRSIVLDRLHAKGWNPDKKSTRHFQAQYFGGKPFDPITQFKISLLIPARGPDLVYDVDTTGAGWGFWVDAHTGEIVREDNGLVN
jgi:hypothetical protein